jgi:hypothetical protein
VTLVVFEPLDNGVKSGEMVQEVPTGIGLAHVVRCPAVVTLNAVLEIDPRKGEVRVTGWLPMFVTVNTPVQGELPPRTGHPVGVPATPEALPRASGTSPN